MERRNSCGKKTLVGMCIYIYIYEVRFWANFAILKVRF